MVKQASEEDQEGLERQRIYFESQKKELGPGYYGHGDLSKGSTKGFDFDIMFSHKRAWNDPVLYHGFNAATVGGGLWGLWFFFRHPVHSKAHHVIETVRRCLTGTLVALPFTLAGSWKIRQSAKESSKQRLRERGEGFRAECLAEGGKTMEAPPDVNNPGPQGLPGQR